MLQHLDIASRSPDHLRTGDTVSEDVTSIVFYSAKNGRQLLVDDRLELSLLRFLEAQPAVQAFETLGGGVVDVRYWAGRVLVAALPSRHAARGETMALKRGYEASGRRTVLVPEGRLTGWPTRDTCRILSESGHAPLTATERLLLLEALQDAGGSSSLGDLAVLLHDREDPVASVLSLVAAGMVRVDLRTPISAVMQVSLFDPLIPFR